MFEEITDDAHLFHGSQVPRVNGVKLELQLFPVRDETFHVIGQVQRAEILVFAMSGEYGGGKRANLKSHVCQYGDGHGQ